MSRQKLLRRLIALLLPFFSTYAAQARFEEGARQGDTPERWCCNVDGDWIPYTPEDSRKIDGAIRFHNGVHELCKRTPTVKANPSNWLVYQKSFSAPSFISQGSFSIKVKKLNKVRPVINNKPVDIFVALSPDGELSSKSGYQQSANHVLRNIKRYGIPLLQLHLKPRGCVCGTKEKKLGGIAAQLAEKEKMGGGGSSLWYCNVDGEKMYYKAEDSRRIDDAILFHNGVMDLCKFAPTVNAKPSDWLAYKNNFGDPESLGPFDKAKVKKLKTVLPLIGDEKESVALYIKCLADGKLSTNEGYQFVNTRRAIGRSGIPPSQLYLKPWQCLCGAGVK